MNVVVLNPELKGQLNGLNEDLELQDESGNTLGHFVPTEQYRKMLYAWVESTCPFTEDELEARSKQPATRTWEQIKARLEAR